MAEQLWSDVRYAARAMRRAPLFTLLVVTILALGIGVNTAIFSIVNGVLLKPLPYPDAERLVWLGESSGSARGISVSWPNFVSWRDDNHSFEVMAAFLNGQTTMTGRGEARPVRGLSVTHQLLRSPGHAAVARPSAGVRRRPARRGADRRAQPPLLVRHAWRGIRPSSVPR